MQGALSSPVLMPARTRKTDPGLDVFFSMRLFTLEFRQASVGEQFRPDNKRSVVG